MREKRERFFWGRKRRFLETVSESGRLWCYGFVFICVYARTLTFGGVVRATTIGGSVIVLNYAVALHWNRGIVFEPWSFGFCFQHFFILLFLGLRYSFYICIEIPNGALECAKNASHCYCHEIIGSSKLVFCSHPCIWNPFLISIFSLIACCGWRFVFLAYLMSETRSVNWWECMGRLGEWTMHAMCLMKCVRGMWFLGWLWFSWAHQQTTQKMELRNFNYSAKIFQPVRVMGKWAMKRH